MRKLGLTVALLVACGDKGGDTTDPTSGPSTDPGTTTAGPTTDPATTDPATTDAPTTGGATDSGTTGTADVSTGDDPSTTTGTDESTTTGTTDDSTPGTTDGTTTGDESTGGTLGEGEVCEDTPDACQPGLLCCYPCGIPDCQNKCLKPDPRTMMCPLFP
jgi:hypothetical protein